MLKKIRLFVIIAGLLLSVIATSAQDSQAISLDEVVTGEITTENYENFYTYEAQAGEVVFIAMNATSDPRLDSFISLLDANGQELDFDDDTGGNLNSLIGPYTFGSSGTYTIVATRFQQANGTATGSYELSIRAANFDSIALDETRDISISSNNDPVIFSFTAPIAGLYQLNYNLLAGEGSSDLSVQDIQGIYITNTNIDSYNPENFAVMALNADEAVYIFIRSYPTYDQNGNEINASVEANFSVTPAVSTPLTFSDGIANVSGVLVNEDSVVYYAFNAEAGQTLGPINRNTFGENYEFYMIMPSGYSNFYGSSYYAENENLVPEQILTETGQYVLVVHRGTLPPEAQNNGQSVTFDFSILLGMTQEITLGTPITDTADGYTQVNGLIYNGQAGESLTITITSLDDNYFPSLYIELQPQDINSPVYTGFNANFSSSVAGTINYDVVLPYSGQYIVRISNGNYNDPDVSGEYEFVINSN